MPPDTSLIRSILVDVIPVAVVMAEDVADVRSVDTPPSDWRALCPTYNQYATANGIQNGINAVPHVV